MNRPFILTQTKTRTLSNLANRVWTDPNEPDVVYIERIELEIYLTAPLFSFLIGDKELHQYLNAEDLDTVATKVLEAHYGKTVKLLEPDWREGRSS